MNRWPGNTRFFSYNGELEEEEQYAKRSVHWWYLGRGAT